MGLAASQITFLALTRRKSSLERKMTHVSSEKMALSRETVAENSRYTSALQNKQVSFYANNKYNTINYNYLMGGGDYTQIVQGASTVKSNNSMILADYKGRVVLSSFYANIISDVMGVTNGNTFSPTTAQYALMLNKITNNAHSVNDFATVINNEKVSSTTEAIDGTDVNNSDQETNEVQKLVDFYLPILKAAARNGWTSEYEQHWDDNSDYISDALVSGTFQLAIVDDDGNYTTEDSLNYFVTAGYVQTNTTSDMREALTAEHEANLAVLNEKETYWDNLMNSYDTELEEIKTTMESIKKIIEDQMSVFNWANA